MQRHMRPGNSFGLYIICEYYQLIYIFDRKLKSFVISICIKQSPFLKQIHISNILENNLHNLLNNVFNVKYIN